MGVWRRVEPTTIDKIGHRTVITKHFELPNGTVHDFQTVSPEGSRGVACIAITPDLQVIVARQFRPGPEKILDEVPGGSVESDEDPLTAVTRELQEETGYRPGHIELLGTIYKDSYNNCIWHYYLATDCVLTGEGVHPDSTEDTEVVLVSIDQFLESARNTRMTDTEAVFLAYDRLKELRDGQSS